MTNQFGLINAAKIRDSKLNVSTGYTLLKNVLKVLSGGLLAQVLNFLSFPIITVWYGPAAFGDYAPFAFFVAFLPMVMSLRMEMAIMQDPDGSEKNALIFLSLISGLLIVGACVITSLFFSAEIKLEIILIVLCAFFASIQNMAVSIANLKERYWLISASRLLFPILFFVAVFLSKDTNVIYPLAKAHITATFLVALFLVVTSGYRVKIASLKEIIRVLKNNFDYIKFDLPSNILNVSALLLPAYLIGIFFDDESSGLYFLAWKIIAAPLSAISLAVGYVYRREAVKEYKANNTFEVVTNKISLLLMSLSALMLLSFYSLGSWIFILLFDEDWQRALPIISILIPMFALKLVASTLSFSFYIVDKLVLDLYGQIFFTVSVSLAVYGGYLLNDFVAAVYFIAIASGFTYLVYGLKSIQFSRGKGI